MDMHLKNKAIQKPHTVIELKKESHFSSGLTLAVV